MENPTYRSWCEGPNVLLWLNGIRGSAEAARFSHSLTKSLHSSWIRQKCLDACTDVYSHIIALTSCHRASVVEQLKAVSHVSSKPVGLAYFYCSYAESENHGFSQIICSIAAQLIRYFEKPEMGPAMRLFNDSDDGTLAPSTKRLETLLVQLTIKMEMVFFCMDALDECSTHTKAEVLRFFVEVIGQHQNVKILISSRTGDSDINEALDGFPSITISQDYVAQDIELFVRYRLERASRRLRKASSDHTIKSLVAGSEGM